MSLNEDQIQKIVNQYKKQRERERLYYQDKKKNDEEFIKKNRERARNHYLNNKEKKKEKYDENKEFRKVKALLLCNFFLFFFYISILYKCHSLIIS